ncbi:MAG TPA: L,D-transpeptidase family protein [Steroidobacteraceae bacterium]|nr:L,D-transpeptidase family protein [Steroidobacteraceae bacterium]
MKLEIRRGRRSGIRIACGLTLLLIGLPSCAGTKPPEPTPRLSPSRDVQAGCSESSGESLTSAAVALAARETWTVRFWRNDHGASRALQNLYASTGGPLWSADGRPTRQALALLEVLRAGAEYGLDPADYDATRLSTLATALRAHHQPGIERTLYRARDSACGDLGEARFDLGLSAAAIALVADLHYGRIDPRAAGFELGAPRLEDLDLANAVRTLTTSQDVARALANFEPQFEHYRLLEQALVHYGKLAAENPTDAVLAARVRKIDLTLERWRWLPAFQTPPIIVNIPEFRLFAFQQTADRAADILQMDVIVGRTFPRTRTPVFAADMKSVIFRPYWYIPRSIIVREMLPKIQANPGYLAAQHLEIVSVGPGAAVLPVTSGSIAALAAGTARLRQQPGPDNALGLIKFDLPNYHDVYLHSTPAQQLFLKSRRAFSHGCIRVSDPVALAAYALRDTPGNWSPGKIEAAMHGTETRRVTLAKPIRVMILYGTVLAKEDGGVLFFDDLYGQDRRLSRLLGLAPVERAIAVPTSK